MTSYIGMVISVGAYFVGISYGLVWIFHEKLRETTCILLVKLSVVWGGFERERERERERGGGVAVGGGRVAGREEAGREVY